MEVRAGVRFAPERPPNITVRNIPARRELNLCQSRTALVWRVSGDYDLLYSGVITTIKDTQ